MNNIQKLDINSEHVDKAIKFTDKVVKSCGTRLAGTPGSYKAMELIKEEYSKYCDKDSIKVEEFYCHPKSFLGYIRIAASLYGISSLLLYFKPELVILVSIGYFMAFFMFLSQFLLYWEVFDPFYKKEKGYNVYGSIEPELETKQQIFISGHHDAAFVFNYLEYKCEMYGIMIIAALIPLVVGLLFTSIWWIYLLVTGLNPEFAYFIQIFQLIGMSTAIPIGFFITKRITPGAGDNMIACAMAGIVAEIFGIAKKEGKNLLKHTRLVFISFDAEEAGLRGSRAFVNRHKDELLSIPTYNYNVDSIYELRNLKLFDRDINQTRPLSRELAEECQCLAKELGYDLDIIGMPIGGGGTDAAEFSRIGVQSTTLIGIATNIIRHNLSYHTTKDDIDKIEPKAVEVGLQICINLILKKESD
jgi:aminopeptidase YwaD